MKFFSVRQNKHPPLQFLLKFLTIKLKLIGGIFMKVLKSVILFLIVSVFMFQDGLAWQSKKTLKSLTDTAPFIVVGRVTALEARNVTIGKNDQFIKTFVTISVEKSIKGKINETSSIIVEVRGGEIDGRTVVSSLSHKFDPQEEVLLFLFPIKDNSFEVAGISGKLPISFKGSQKLIDCSPLKSEENGFEQFQDYSALIDQISNYLKSGGN